MKTHGSCPKCACAKLYVVEEIRQPDQESANGIHPLVVTTAAVAGEDVGIADGNSHRAPIGRFEAWICSSCGFTEWYAKEVAVAFERLAQMAKQGRRVHVRIAEKPAGEPFR